MWTNLTKFMNNLCLSPNDERARRVTCNWIQSLKKKNQRKRKRKKECWVWIQMREREMARCVNDVIGLSA